MEYDAPFDPDDPDDPHRPTHRADDSYDAADHGPVPIPGPESGEQAFESRPVAMPRGSDREGLSPLALGLLIVLVVALSAVAYWWFALRVPPLDGPLSPGTATMADEEAAGGAPPSPPELAPSDVAVDLPTLEQSDPWVRETAHRLSEHPALVRWLAHEDLVRRFVATVDNVAAGQSPRGHVEFMAPAEPFRADLVDERLVPRQDTYGRYDLAVDVFTSLDIGAAVQLYHSMEPLLEEAYGEIGAPGTTFRGRLRTAIDNLLAVEIPEQAPELEQTIVSYHYADPRYEELDPAAKHLLRLGPERAARVQTKLEFLRAGLDLDAEAEATSSAP